MSCRRAELAARSQSTGAHAEPPLGGTVDAITRTLSAYAVELCQRDED